MRPSVGGQLGGEHQADGHGLAVAEVVAAGHLQGVGEGVAVVEHGPRPVRSSGSSPATTSALMATHRAMRSSSGRASEVVAGEEVVLGHLAVPAAPLPLGQRRQQLGVAQHGRRRPEGADQVLALRQVHAGLAADGGVDHPEQRGRHVHHGDAAVVGGGGEAGRRRSPCRRRRRRRSRRGSGPARAKRRHSVLDGGQRLGSLAVADRDHLVLEPGTSTDRQPACVTTATRRTPGRQHLGGAPPARRRPHPAPYADADHGATTRSATCSGVRSSMSIDLVGHLGRVAGRRCSAAMLRQRGRRVVARAGGGGPGAAPVRRAAPGGPQPDHLARPLLQHLAVRRRQHHARRRRRSRPARARPGRRAARRSRGAGRRPRRRSRRSPAPCGRCGPPPSRRCRGTAGAGAGPGAGPPWSCRVPIMPTSTRWPAGASEARHGRRAALRASSSTESPPNLRCASAASTRATIVSATTPMAGTAVTSVRSLKLTVSSLVTTSTVLSVGRFSVASGFMAARTTSSSPVIMPPSTPPARVDLAAVRPGGWRPTRWGRGPRCPGGRPPRSRRRSRRPSPPGCS